MSTNSTASPTKGTTAPAEGVNADAVDAADTGSTEGGGANAEAAKYRTQLRASETQVTALAGVVQTYQTKDVQALAEAAGLASGADLFVAGTTLADLLDEAGNVDEARVKAASGAVLQSHPHWRRVPVKVEMGSQSAGPAEAPQEVTWAKAFKGS
jgi:hypothetical protein